MRASIARLAPPLKLAVVGSGPSAFYAASRILSAFPAEKGTGDDGVEVHMYERLPTPFGLSRYGVAPDHPEVKNVEHKFASVAEDPRFSFFGNVNVVAGKEMSSTSGYTYPSARRLTLAELRPHYTQLLLAYGSSQARPLGIPGSSPGELLGVHDALNFVNWYNGHPAAHDEQLLAAEPHRRIDLGQGRRHMTVIGAGNVALDVARIVLRGSLGGGAAGGASSMSATRARTALAETDVPESVLAHIAASQIERVDIFARRGPAQVAFTNKELREILSLPGVVFEGVGKADMAEAHDAVAQLESRVKEDPSLSGEARVRKRLLGLLEKGSTTKPQAGVAHKEWGLNFFRAPAAFLGDGVVKGVRWNVTSLPATSTSARLPDAPWNPSSTTAATSTGNTQDTSTDLVVSSVGYRGSPLEGQPPAEGAAEDLSIPWDEKRGIVPNEGGRVVRGDGTVLPGVYVSGWLARGPVGVIASTLANAYATVDLLLSDWREPQQRTLGGLKVRQGSPATTGAGQNDAIDWQGWLRIDDVEVKKGKELGKPREKMLAVDDMRTAAGGR